VPDRAIHCQCHDPTAPVQWRPFRTVPGIDMAAPIKPGHKAIHAYYEALKIYAGQQVEHEGALETAFSRLLADTARPHGWALIPKMSLKVGSKQTAPGGGSKEPSFSRGKGQIAYLASFFSLL
jgi:hypothetical protein